MRDPSLPLVTWYDELTGERVELSGTTFDNWVAKTANFATDELGLESGDTIALLLEPHWSEAVWLATARRLGLTVLSQSDPSAEVTVVGSRDSHDLSVAAHQLVLMDVRPMSVGLMANTPAGAIDFFSEVRVHGDHYSGPDSDELSVDELSATEVESQARRLAADEDFVAEERLLIASPSGTSTVTRWLAIDPMRRALDASIVLAHGAGAQRLNAIAEQENVTATML